MHRFENTCGGILDMLSEGLDIKVVRKQVVGGASSKWLEDLELSGVMSHCLLS